MPEVAVNTPFDSNEIKDIACEEFRKVLDRLGPLQGAKEYSAFNLGFNVTIGLYRPGEGAGAKETLAWRSVQIGPVNPDDDTVSAVTATSFKSGDPNDERMARNMPMTVETTDGRGGKTRKKVFIKE